MFTNVSLRPGVDMICAQGGEGGGHTGDTPFSIFIPAVVDICKDAKSPLTGQPIIVVAAGGIADGRGLAVAFSYVVLHHFSACKSYRDGYLTLPAGMKHQVSGLVLASLQAEKLVHHQCTRSLYSLLDTMI
jgi:hypothetical protein